MAFKFIAQRDVMQCGIACLAMLCKHWGASVTLHTIEELCTVTREGVSMLALSKAASKLGLKNVALNIPVDRLLEAPLPAILHWNQNHFVILYKVSSKGKYFYVADPGKGKIKYKKEEFEKHWLSSTDSQPKGIAMFFEPSDNFEVLNSNKDESKISFGFLFRYLRKYQRQLAFVVITLLLGCVMQLILPFLTQSIVDVGIRDKDIGIIWLILLGQTIIVIGRTATDFIRSWLLLRIGMHINISLISDFFSKLLKLPMSFFDKKMIGDIMQRMGDHSRVQQFLTTQVLSVIFSIIGFFVFGIVLLIYNITIFAIFLAGSALYATWIALFLRRRKVLDYEMFEHQSTNNNKTYQFVSYMQEIKLQECENRRRQEWETVQYDLFGAQMRSLKLQQTQEAGGVFINELKNLVITIVAATAVITGDMTLGAMLAVQYVIGQLNSPVEQLMSFIYSMQDVKLSLDRINEIHNNSNEDNLNNTVDSFTNTDHSIVLKNVSFKYDTSSFKYALKNICITIPHNKVTAIVGASGSGKTTLIKLILGYYPTTSGDLTIAGKGINTYTLKWWRHQCGVVMQDGIIFSESIARNIAVSDDDIDYERLEKAARLANIHDFISALPLKYNTIIGRDGIGISQGQKQRILIARAIYKMPEFIILDEATNSLDADNERAIVDNLTEFYKGRTVIVVAHRLSTVRHADQIIVLKDGCVSEVGTHDKLILQQGVYYHLVKNQLELGS